jgi:SAM-dependent methyltransferase/septal ring factor EnvC (AmiA/AmiB activator)
VAGDGSSRRDRGGPGSEAERFEPELHGPLIAYEHLHRYALAAELLAGARVLDLASGSGHGSAMLRAAGADVTALDIDPTSARRAAPAVCASGDRLPFADESFEAVVCFETIEHLDEPQALVAEIHRVLERGGVALLSTPDRSLYTDLVGNQNPYHVSELTREEFRDVLSEQFGHVAVYGQSVWAGSWISLLDEEEERGDERAVSIQHAEVQREEPEGSGSRVRAPWIDPAMAPSGAPLPTPLYLVALCARQKGAFGRVARRIGSDRLLDDRAQWLIGAYLGALDSLLSRDRDVEGHRLNASNLEQRVIERNAQIVALTQQLKERDARVRELEGHVANLEPDLTEREARVKALEGHVEGMERELDGARGRSRDLERHAADLETIVEASQAHSENLERQLSESQAHVRNLEVQVGAVEAHVQSLEQAVRGAEGHLEEAQSATVATRTHFEEALRGAEDHSRNVEEALQGTQEHARDLEEALGGVQQHVEQLGQRVEDERRQRAAVETTAAAFQSRAAELEGQLARTAEAFESVQRRAEEGAEALARIRATRAYRVLQALALLEPRE